MQKNFGGVWRYAPGDIVTHRLLTDEGLAPAKFLVIEACFARSDSGDSTYYVVRSLASVLNPSDRGLNGIIFKESELVAYPTTAQTVTGSGDMGARTGTTGISETANVGSAASVPEHAGTASGATTQTQPRSTGSRSTG